jgi:hypothetical protein
MLPKKSKLKPGAGPMAKARGNAIQPMGPQGPRGPKIPLKPKGKKDSEGRYNFSKGGSANLIASAMEVQKPN